jgi:hypothetical protein
MYFKVLGGASLEDGQEKWTGIHFVTGKLYTTL